MENTLIKKYKTYRSNSFRTTILTALAIVIGTSLNLFFSLPFFINHKIILFDFGSFLTAGMISPMAGIICCLFSSLVNPLVHNSVSTSFITLTIEITILLMTNGVSKKWFKSIPKTLLLAFINITIGFIGVIINQILNAIATISTFSVLSPENLLITFTFGVPMQVVSMIMVYLALNMLPDNVLLQLPNGVYYVRDAEFQEYIKEYRVKCRIKSIEMRMYHGITILVILLTLTASFSFNTLYFKGFTDTENDFILNEDDYKDILSSIKLNKSTDADSDLSSLKDAVKKELPLIEWSDPNGPAKNIAFFFKFISMLLCIELAVAVICVTYLRASLIEPIISVSSRASKCSPNDNNIDEIIDVEPLEDLDIRSGDEIEELYYSILKTLAGFNRYVMRMYHEQQLMNELEIEKKTGKAKSEFLSNMSHELRTPINAVIGLDEVILRESKEESTLSLASDIQAAGKSLLSLVNDILDFSKIEAGKMDIIPVNYDLSSVVNDLVNMIKIRADKKHLDLIVEVCPETPHLLYGDEIRLKQVITNILTNAVKYTEKGSVTLSVSHSQISAREINLSVSVKDTGIGMQEDDLGKLFKAFERIEEKRNRTIEGTGLGLNITQSLLNLMGSRLEVKSIYGEGTTFFFDLKQTILSDEPIGELAIGKIKSFSPDILYKESFTAPDAEILVVDDTEMNLTVVKGLLKQTRIKIDTAESGFECLRKVQEKHYDIVFLDHRMPEMDGMETLKKFIELDKNKCADTPVIALTANALSGARESYIDAGFTDYLTKPIDYKKLEKMIMDYLPEKKIIPSTEAETIPEAINLPSWLSDSDALNLTEALKNCGSEETFLDALNNFYNIIDDNSAEIDAFFAAKDWHNYNIKVHALKSSARLIGAEKLSSLAYSLEVASDDSGANEGYIKIHHDPLMNLYRSYIGKLSPLSAASDSSDDDTSDKEMITNDELEDAFASVLELIESIDYETADELIRSLDKYSIPESDKEKYEQLKKFASAFDWDSAAGLLRR